MKRFFGHVLSVAALVVVAFCLSNASGEFDGLEPDQEIGSFAVANVYENEAGNAVGVRLRHLPSGFVLDVLRIQSLPQGFIWVNTPPTSDMGRPHAIEHLVLGKGPKAQYVASFENMSLASSSAGTDQVVTGYHFYSTAGKENFFEFMELKIDALIHPDYSDEEIRREMCNLGYSVDPVDSSIVLEEKGSVYTEMVSVYEGRWENLAITHDALVYGENHPLSNSSGGYPPDIRRATFENIRNFHDSCYHLNNMGMILSVPDEIGFTVLVERTSGILARIEPGAFAGEDPVTAQERFPEPHMARIGTIAVAEFPSQNENDPGLLLYTWPAVLAEDRHDAVVQDLLINNMANGGSSNLYQTFINSQTRLIDLGARDVFGQVSEDQGRPITIGFSDISPEIATEKMIDSVRGIMLAQFQAVANFADGSDELKAFNQRASNRVMQIRRDIRRNLNSPPGFGSRHASWWWLEHLQRLRHTPGFRKQLVPNDPLAFAESLLESGKNFWRDYIAKWSLLTNKPYGVAARANPKMIGNMEAERRARIAGYVEDLKKQYGVEDERDALERFVADYDDRTAVIDAASKTIQVPSFTGDPPLSLDEQLEYRVEELPGGGDNVVATFDNITSAEFALAMKMDVVPESMLVYVGGLPTMLAEVGVIKDGKPISFDMAQEMMRREVLRLEVRYDISLLTQRVELTARASGSVLEESQKGMDWMSTVLFNPDWRIDNLPRIRDAVDAALIEARNGMKGWEEFWVDIPGDSYYRQSNPLILSAHCFLTKQHDLLWLRWMLREISDEASLEAFTHFLDLLAVFGETASRAELEALTARLLSGEASDDAALGATNVVDRYSALPESVCELARDAVRDLQYLLPGFPDNSLASDWIYVCGLVKSGLARPASDVLIAYGEIMRTVLRKDNVRGYFVGSSASQELLLPRQNEIVKQFSDDTSIRQTYSDTPVVHERLRGRIPGAEPVYVGLINSATRNGVFIFSAPGAGYTDYSREKLLDYLAGRLYGGGGAHSLFMKTWAAGLAYSNGIGYDQASGRSDYYADRCPSLVQTMQFVINEIENAQPDASLIDYAVAQAFRANRAGNTYESRGAWMAADLADGLTPEVIAGYRQAVLNLRTEPGLLEKLSNRLQTVCGRVMPGLGPNSASVDGGNFFMIGPEEQFVSFEEYLRTVEGDDVTLYRVYPRDFWIVD